MAIYDGIYQHCGVEFTQCPHGVMISLINTIWWAYKYVIYWMF